MYVPVHFEENRPEALFALIRSHPLATLVSHGDDGLIASHVPMALEVDETGQATLACHLARANPHCAHALAGREVLAIFQGAEAYVSPGWYASKREHGKVVPTWNYVAVHCTGRFETFGERETLHAHVAALSDRHEAGQAHPWAVADAPPDFVAMQLRAILGVRIPVTRMEGKWKMSQNRPESDRKGVVEGLSAAPEEGSREVAQVMAEREAGRG